MPMGSFDAFLQGVLTFVCPDAALPIHKTCTAVTGVHRVNQRHDHPIGAQLSPI